MKPKILVMGAVGKTGKEVTLGLLAKGFPVRAFVRVDDHRADKLRQAGAEIFGFLHTFGETEIGRSRFEMIQLKKDNFHFVVVTSWRSRFFAPQKQMVLIQVHFMSK